MKAKLLVKGFQDVNVDNIRNDSPTDEKEAFHVVLETMISHDQTFTIMDMKTAGLESKQFDRLAYINPPQGTSVLSNYIKKLSKCVYSFTSTLKSW